MVHPAMNNNTHVPPDSIPSGARRPNPHAALMDVPAFNQTGVEMFNRTCRPLGAEACISPRSQQVPGRSLQPSPAFHGDAYVMPAERPPSTTDPGICSKDDLTRRELWRTMQQASCTEHVARISLFHRTVLLVDCVSAANQQQQAEEWQLEILRNEYAGLAQIETRNKMADEHLLQLFQRATSDSSSLLVDDFASMAGNTLSDIHGLVDDANARVSSDAFQYKRILPRQEPERAPSKQIPNHGAHGEDVFRHDAHSVTRRGEIEHPSAGPPPAGGMANESKRKGWEISMYDEDGQVFVPGYSSSNGIHDCNGQARPRQGGWAAAADADKGRGQACRQQPLHAEPRGGKGSESGNNRRGDDPGPAEAGISRAHAHPRALEQLYLYESNISWQIEHFAQRAFPLSLCGWKAVCSDSWWLELGDSGAL
jgi:hypothetical protein